MRLIVTLVLALLLSNAAWADLAITDVRAVEHHFGPEKKVLEIIPGDDIYIRYTVTGIQTDAGKMNGSVQLQVSGPDGKVLVNETSPLQQQLALGGDSFPGFSRVSTGVDTPEMEMTIKVTITDKLAEKSASFEKKFKVLKKEFGIAKIGFFADKDGASAAPVGGLVSQRVFFRFYAVHFDKSMKKIALTMQIQFLDDQGKPLAEKPLEVKVNSNDPEKVPMQLAVPFSGSFTLNRAGKFQCKITIKDDVSGKDTSYTCPIEVK